MVYYYIEPYNTYCFAPIQPSRGWSFASRFERRRYSRLWRVWRWYHRLHSFSQMLSVVSKHAIYLCPKGVLLLNQCDYIWWSGRRRCLWMPERINGISIKLSGCREIQRHSLMFRLMRIRGLYRAADLHVDNKILKSEQWTKYGPCIDTSRLLLFPNTI